MSNKRPRLSLRTLRKGMILVQVVARIDSEVVKERTFVESLRKRFFVSSEEAPDLAAADTDTDTDADTDVDVNVDVGAGARSDDDTLQFIFRFYIWQNKNASIK